MEEEATAKEFRKLVEIGKGKEMDSSLEPPGKKECILSVLILDQ